MQVQNANQTSWSSPAPIVSPLRHGTLKPALWLHARKSPQKSHLIDGAVFRTPNGWICVGRWKSSQDKRVFREVLLASGENLGRHRITSRDLGRSIATKQLVKDSYTSGIEKWPAVVSGPERLSVPSFCSSSMGACDLVKTTLFPAYSSAPSMYTPGCRCRAKSQTHRRLR